MIAGGTNAIAVWEFTNELAGSNPPVGIWASRYTRVDLWSRPVQIDAGEGGSRKPSLAADAAGNAFCVWEEVKDDGSQEATIWTNRFVVGEGWGTPERLQASVLPSLRPAVAADADGNAIAVWVEQEFPSNKQVIRARRYEVGSGWGVNEAIDTMPTVSVPGAVDVKMDGERQRHRDLGRAHQADGRRQRRGALGEPLRRRPGLGDRTPDQERPRNRSRERAPGREPERRGARGLGPVRRHADHSVRGAAQRHLERPLRAGLQLGHDRLERAGAHRQRRRGRQAGPAIAVDGSGVAHAVWSQDDNILQNDFKNIYANRYTAESGWGTPVIIESPSEDPRDDADATTPQVAVNADGNTFVVWRQDWEDWGSIWSNRIDPGEPWVPENGALIEIIGRAARTPSIVVDDSRHAHAAWMHAVETQIDRVRPTGSSRRATRLER